MKKLAIAFFFLSFLLCRVTHASNYLVTVYNDELGEGTLRVLMQHACEHEGDDAINFAPTRLDEIRLVIGSPLVIPADCKGTLSIYGRSDVDTIIDASELSSGSRRLGDVCSLDIYSDDNFVTKFSYVNNNDGAGICIYGRNNVITESNVGSERDGTEAPNLYGIFISDLFSSKYAGMDGYGTKIMRSIVGPQLSHGIWLHADDATLDSNKVVLSGGNGINVVGSSVSITNNDIKASGGHGILLHATDVTIFSNEITGNGGCPSANESIAGQPECYESSNVKGSGIMVKSGSNNILIGGSSFEANKNVIQYNKNGGVVLQNDAAITNVKITHNSIAKNYGDFVSIDMSADGTTPNDLLDDDEGPDTLLNFHQHLQAFRLVNSSDGTRRFWTWGVTFYSDEVELYQVPPEDISRRVLYGGGDVLLADLTTSNNGFEKIVSGANADSKKGVTSMNLYGDNSSEFGMNASFAADSDYDGIEDSFETGDGSEQSGSTSKNDADTDGDGLPDPVEDRNHNGKWDKDLGETCAYKADSDDDGLNDFAETHGDAIYNPGRDTDPFNPDTDGDGLMDGKEDKNGNGVWEGYLKESSPLIVDSDNDGFADAVDSCPSIPNPGQEPWYCANEEVAQ